MANTACSIKTPQITSAFLSKEGNEILSAIKAPRYVDYINYLFGNVFKREYLDNNSYVTLSDFTDDNNKLTVNGNLNNLYGKVKEELKNQVNDPTFLINVPDEIKNQTASELIKILENWKLFVDYHSKYNAYIAINPEDLEEEKELNNFDKRGNEHNEFQLLTNEVRTLFKFLPSATLVKNSEGELVGSPIINPADGLPIRADFENVFKLTLDALKGIKDDDKFIEKLISKEVLQRIPELSFVFDILPINIDGTTNNFTNKQRQLFHHFFLVMSRDYIPVYASDLEVKEDDLPIFRRFKSARGNVDKIEKQFISNFLSNQIENDYVKVDNTIDEENPENSVFGRKRLYSLPTKLPFIDLSDEEIKKLNRKSKILSDFKDYFDFFELLGIEFSDFSLIPDKKELIKILNLALPIHDSLTERLSIGNKIFNPIEDLKQQIKYVDKNSKPKTIKSLRQSLRDIFKFEGSISKISPTLVTKAANGENQSDITYPNAISIAAQQINDSSSLDDLYSKPYFKKLKYNPLHKNSYVGSRVVGNPNISYSIENYSGFTIIKENESKSFDTKSLSDVNKFISDFNNLMGSGVINTPQLESKAGYSAIKFIDKNTNKAILPFSESQFTNDFITSSDFTAQVIHYLHGEIERVRNFSKVKQYAPSNYGKFFIFNNFVTDEVKANLLKDKNTTDYKKAEEEVLIKLNEHFNNELKNIEDFIKNNDISNFISDKVLTESKISKELFKNNKEEYTKSLLRAFIANDFIHNVEFGIYVSGDPLFYKDYHKRLGGLSSTGTQPVPTNNLKQLFNSDSEKLFWDNFSLRGILNQLSTPSKIAERRDNFHTFLSAVLKENNVKENTEFQNPKTIEDYIYSVELKNGVSITTEEAASDLKIEKIESKGIDVGDGQGYLNLDAARELSIKQGIYRPQQDVSYRFEALIFKQMLLEEKGEKLSEDEFKLLKKEERRILQNPDKYALPTLKQTYYGTISNKEVEIDAKIFDKFSLAIVLPSVARNHPELKKLLLAMAKRQIHYVKYESGTKGFVRDVFRNIDELANEKNELDELETSLLKLQITPSKTEKTSTKIPTQKIKLLFTNLFDGSKANKSVKDLRNKFITDLNNIKNFNRKNILKKLGFELNEEGNISSWNKEKIIDALVSQVNLQKLPTPMLEALETDNNGNFLNTIESSNIYQQLLNYVSGKLDSTLREFKINGGDFVLFSESMFSKPLKYVRLSKDRKTIENMECRITLTKEYSKLLNLPDLLKAGQLIGTVERLNELLTNAEFKDKYKKELTIVFSRPPVQGPNSMGVASVVEFFHPTAGNILQLPKEFMHQAGIDFDYDKEKVILPSLSSDGVYASDENITNKINELDSKYSELRDIYDYYQDVIDPEDFESYEDYTDMKNQILNNDDSTKLLAKILNIDFENIPSKLNELNDKINEYFSLKEKEKSVLSNNLLDSIQKSLQQPEIYSELILPNTDETVKPLAIANGKDINNLNTLPQGIDVYSYFQNLKVFKLFNDAKALLGPFALHNVFIELIAPLDIKVNLDYAFNKDGIPQKRVNLLLLNNSDRSVNISSKYDIDGNVKQHITSEFINATVDSAKDPYFANFMLSFDSINTFTFLMALGYPIDLIVDFTSSAAIRKYLMYKQRDLKTEDAVTRVLNEIKAVPLKKSLRLGEIFIEDLKNLNKDNSDIINKLKDLKSDDSLIDKNYKYHFALLSNFVALEEHSRQFSNFRSLFRNDTNKTSSLYEISSKESLKKSVIFNGMFSLKDIENVENNSTISAFRNDDLIGEVLKTIFPLMSEPEVYKGLGNLFEDSKQNLKEVDKRILSQVITNDYITNILFSFGTYKDQNFFLYGRDLIIKTEKEDKTLNKTLLERLHKFKQNKAYESLTKQFPVLTKILGEISLEKLKKNPVYSDKNGFKHGFNIMLNIDSNTPILEKEGFMNQFKQILDGDFTTENPMVKTALINLVQDFFIAGLIQSGFNKTNISYLEYAPVKFIQSLLNPALNRYNYNAKNNPEFLKKFVQYFSNELFKYNNAKFFYFKKEDRPRIYKNTHLGKYLYIPGLIKTSASKTEKSKNINIYSTDKNGFNKLSNLLVGPVEFNGFKYKTIEHLYQWKKANFAGDQETANKIFYAKTGFEAQKLSKKIQGLDSAEWNKVSSQELEEAMRLAYEQNPQAKELLLSTGNNILTHKGPFDMGKWETEFPRILMQIRNEYLGVSQNTSLITNSSEIDISKYVNHSGGALGSDTEWDNIGKDFGMVNNKHYWVETKTPNGNTEITKEDFEEGRYESAKAAKRNFGYAYKAMKDSRLIRNWSQVKYSEAVFAIGKIVKIGEKLFPNQKSDTRVAENPSVTGGTGYAVGMAINHNKPVYVFNQTKGSYDIGWYKWDNYSNDFIKIDVPILTKNFAGIGTREINDLGKKAIVDVYSKTSKKEDILPEANISQLEKNISKNIFEYKNKTIETEFQLGEQQEQALKDLIDFEDSREMFITLQGAAGTGKTTIIGYLQKYLGKKASFAYLAPTHAATAELAFATVKTGSNILPSTLQSSITLNAKTKTHVFTQKITKRLGFNPIIVLDESSMIDQSDIDKIKEAAEDIGAKVIFLGDEKQISKVTTDNTKIKNVSPAFTKFKQVKLTKIYRQSNNSLLNLLSKMREQTDFKLFKVENSDVVKFLNRADFGRELVKDLMKDAENTVVITYTNASVKGTNINIRQVLGRTGQTVVDDIVVGYLGYASKQIEKGDIANSISYIITNIEEDKTTRIITAKSPKLEKLIDSGIGNIDSTALTVYYQLNADDSLTFDNLTKEDYATNNKLVSFVFANIHKANIAYANQEINYSTYLGLLAGYSDELRRYSVGNSYIYNPTTKMMEKFDANRHKGIKSSGQGSLLIEKDIDYGHAITIHKSQGSTIDNVYFDSGSLKSAKNTPIVDTKGNQVTTEKMSLAYVAMSRSKKKLVVYMGDNEFELLPNNNPINDPNLDNIGFKKSCE